MCRNCPMPVWGDPVTCLVADLPAYFAKQISWNFERLNFGNATVIDTPSGRAERPSVTARVGCRLQEKVKSEGTGRVPDRYLLVSEVLYCPGKRYGCTPRPNCTGKRRHCWAQCKITVYADQDDVAKICYSGSHGTGNVEDVSRHRPLPAVMREVKRQRVESGATPGQTVQWMKKFVEERGISPDDARFVLKESQLRSLVQRMCKNEGEGGTSVLEDVSTEQEASSEQFPEENHENNSEEWQDSQPGTSNSETAFTESGGEVDNEVSVVQRPEEPSPVEISENQITASPLNTPLSGPSTTVVTPKLFRDGEQFLQNLFSSPQSSTSNNTPQRKETTVLVCSSDQARKTVSLPGQKQVQTAKDDEIERLKHHVHVLEQENLSKISKVAQLEVEVKLLQQRQSGEIERLKKEVNRLKEENNRKSATISELEKVSQIAYTVFRQKGFQLITTESSQAPGSTEKPSSNGNVTLSVTLSSEKSSDLPSESL